MYKKLTKMMSVQMCVSLSLVFPLVFFAFPLACLFVMVSLACPPDCIQACQPPYRKLRIVDVGESETASDKKSAQGVKVHKCVLTSETYMYTRVERCARIRSISRYFGVITRQSRVVFSCVFAFSRPNTVRTRVISPIDGRETARKRSDNINTFYVLFAPAREFIRETA